MGSNCSMSTTSPTLLNNKRLKKLKLKSVTKKLSWKEWKLGKLNLSSNLKNSILKTTLISRIFAQFALFKDRLSS